jgi:alpha-tubulin suppressor-like RCC1 family protein
MDIELPPTMVITKPGRTGSLAATVLPPNANPQSVNWISSNTAVATVAGSGIGATVTAVAVGTVAITATVANSGLAANCAVTVEDSPSIEVPLIATLAGGNSHSLAIRDDGSLWSFGRNQYGQLGLSDNVDRDVPTRVGSDTDWAAVVAAAFSSHALKRDGSLWALGGYNDSGALGIANNTNRNYPTRVGADSDWAVVAAGYEHMMAIKTDGSLWAWGLNSAYRMLGLGDGGTANRNVPTRVGADSDWAAVACGYYHTLALKRDGSIWVWGRNNVGQLGLGDTENRQVPTRVGADSDWTAVSVGNASQGHSLAFKADGSVWAWGSNGYGQLGLGDTARRPSPTQVVTAAGWAATYGGAYYSLALTASGAIMTWGANDEGQLGLGDNDWRTVPVQMGVDTNWVSVTCGQYHNLALKADGSLWSWGNNYGGELGIGPPVRTQRSTPVLVGAGYRVPR